MRVISGKYRGMNLAEFSGKDIRPTADRVKESLFNIIADRIAGARALDLFCGSGSLGIECLSRGAEFAQFNDISPASIAVLRKNLARLRNENFAVSRGDWAECLYSAKAPFDIVFIDPPYADDCGIYAVKLLAKRKLLAPGGVAVYERDRTFSGEVEGFVIVDERKYGKTYLTFFSPARCDKDKSAQGDLLQCGSAEQGKGGNI